MSSQARSGAQGGVAEGGAAKKWWLVQLGFFVLMVLVFNVMWTQMGHRVEGVRDTIKSYEQGLEALNKDVAELQQQVVVVMDAGSRHDGALRASIQNQRNAVQEQLRLLQQHRDLQQAARSFVTTEEPDALRVLSMAERAREDAAPRLSAYLLLDAALGATI